MKFKLIKDWDSHDDSPKKGDICEGKIITRKGETSVVINFDGKWWKTDMNMIKVIER